MKAHHNRSRNLDVRQQHTEQTPTTGMLQPHVNAPSSARYDNVAGAAYLAALNKYVNAHTPSGAQAGAPNNQAKNYFGPSQRPSTTIDQPIASARTDIRHGSNSKQLHSMHHQIQVPTTSSA